MTKITSLGVYCGSRHGNNGAFRDAARRLGAQLAERGIRLVYGGGKIGIMGDIADAVLAGGGKVTGIIPRHLEEIEVGHREIDDFQVVPNMHERKRRMSELSDGFVILPGGLGTLDELFETVTWKQLGLHDKPIVIADIAGYWTPLGNMIEGIIEAGFADGAVRTLFTVVDDVEAILPALAAMPEPTHPIQSKRL
jgi:uncharacterized protein (TIGR00730 family)